MRQDAGWFDVIRSNDHHSSSSLIRTLIIDIYIYFGDMDERSYRRSSATLAIANDVTIVLQNLYLSNMLNFSLVLLPLGFGNHNEGS